MKKLYIITDGEDLSDSIITICWGETKKDAEDNYMNYCQFKNIDPLIEYVKFTIFPEAIHKADINQAINRYILKPINK